MWPSRPGFSMPRFGTTSCLAESTMKKGLSEMFAHFHESLGIPGPSEGKLNAECAAVKTYPCFWRSVCQTPLRFI